MGKLLIYTGNGKGKTTAALGAALRAVGHKQRVAIIQFCKSASRPSGEITGGKRLQPYLTIERFGGRQFISAKPKPVDFTAAAKAWQYLKKLDLNKLNLLILDELNIALYFKLLKLPPVLSWLNSRPKNLTIIITGRKAPEKLIAIADLVTEMTEIKHYYRVGEPAIEGIDY